MMAHLAKTLAILLLLGVDFAPAGTENPLSRDR